MMQWVEGQPAASVSGGVVRLRIGEVALVMSPATARRVAEALGVADEA